MTKTQLKDALRNIWKQKITYMSVIVITILAVNAYLGISFAATMLTRGVSGYYNDNNYHDIEIRSPLLLTAEDINILRKLPCVASAEGHFNINAVLHGEDGDRDVQINSITNNIDNVEILEGRLPTSRNECAMEYEMAKAMGIGLGDTVEPDVTTDMAFYSLAEKSLKVTGIFKTPEHVTWSFKVSQVILVTRHAFKSLGADGSFPVVEVRFTGAGDYEDRYERGYLKALDQAMAAIDEIGPGRYKVRKAEVSEQIDSVETKLGEDASDRVDLIRNYIADGDNGNWIVLSIKNNPGFYMCLENANNLRSLSGSFSIIFIVVASLVIYSSVSKMAVEQMRMVGVCKALGLRNREVLAKYMMYGVSGTGLGSLLGVLMAYFVTQPLIFSVYGGYYDISGTAKAFLILPTVILVVVLIVLGVLAVNFACLKMLKIPAVQLINEFDLNGIKSKSKKVVKGRLYPNLILRNMRTDIRQIVVIIAGTAGCCILIMIGFSLKYAIERTPKIQFVELQHYDQVVTFDSDLEGAGEAMSKALSDVDHMIVSSTERTFRAGKMMNIAKFNVMDSSRMTDFYDMKDYRTGEHIDLGDDGVYVTSKFLDYYGMSIGDTIYIYDDLMIPREVKISGCFKNYVSELMFLTPACYEKTFGSKVTYDSIFINTTDANVDELRERLSGMEGFKEFKAAYNKDLFEKMSGGLGFMVIVLILMSGFLAYFILMNLTDSYVLQKKRELTIMRINGFTVGECIRYAATELIIAVIIGLGIGIAAGSFMGAYVVRLVEQSGLQFVKDLDIRSVLFSVLITVVFAAVIDWLSLRKIKGLKMVELK